MERVVDRSELLSEQGTPPPSPNVDHIKHLGKLEFVEQKNASIAEAAAIQGSDDELYFVLFAPAAKKSSSSQAVAKIRIQTTPPDDREPAFVVPDRPEAYYFTGELSDEQQQNSEAAALSGQDVLLNSHSLVAGSAYAWKVQHISIPKRQLRALECHVKVPDGATVLKHKRPGKKARVKARTKLETTKTSQEQEQKAAELKEAAEREKRTRRNREKKAKKKLREKAKKAEGQAGDGDVTMEESSDSE